MSAGVRPMPLPSSVSRAAMDPTMVTSSPSRIHTVPSPTTIIQWKRDHGSRSMRAGIRVVRVPRPASSAIAVTPSPGRWLCVPVRRRYVVTLRAQITLLRANRVVSAGTAGAGVRPGGGRCVLGQVKRSGDAMTLQHMYAVLLVGGSVLLASITGARVAHGAGLPSLLFFLAVGLILGEDGIGLDFDDARVAQAVGTGALALILPEGC